MAPAPALWQWAAAAAPGSRARCAASFGGMPTGFLGDVLGAEPAPRPRASPASSSATRDALRAYAELEAQARARRQAAAQAAADAEAGRTGGSDRRWLAAVHQVGDSVSPQTRQLSEEALGRFGNNKLTKFTLDQRSARYFCDHPERPLGQLPETEHPR
ncbi:unnamed protein product, partial [Prorocentrum cordatum]